jgi:VanZ family protein
VIILWLPVVAWMAAIYYGAGMAAVPSTVASISDTVQHVFAYVVLAILTLRALANSRRDGITGRTLGLALLIAILHGMSVEWEQMYIPTRMAEWRDVGNDAIGASLGLACAWAWSKIRG